MSDTPKTDLWLGQQIVCNHEHDQVSAEFARKLERECDELREQLYIAVEMLSTHPKFENKHPEEVWEIVKEAAK
jgi:hypothetical protein